MGFATALRGLFVSLGCSYLTALLVVSSPNNQFAHLQNELAQLALHVCLAVLGGAE